MSEPEQIYHKQFWPTPNQPSFATIELTLRRHPESEIQWEFNGEVKFGQGSQAMISRAGEFEAISLTEAKAKAYSQLVSTLGSVVADLVNERDDYRRLLEAEKAKTQGSRLG